MYSTETGRTDRRRLSWSFPSVRDLDADIRPTVYYRRPDGKTYNAFRRVQAKHRDDLEGHIDDQEDEELEAAVEAFVEASDDEVGDQSREQLRRTVATLDYVPDEGLYDEFLGFCVAHVTGVENIGRRDGDGTLQEVRWEDDEQLCQLYDVDEADEARRIVVASLGRTPHERVNSVFELARVIAEGLPEGQKKPSGS